VPAMGARMGLDLPTAKRRAYAALRRGYLANLQPAKGQPARLALGKPLPDATPGALAPGTVALHLHVLKEALGQAVKWGLLARNPAADVEPPRQAAKEVQSLTKEQALALLAGAQGDRLFMPIVLALGLGLRRGEVFGLQWRDVAPDFGTVAVRRSLQENGLGFKEPKTRKGRRVLTVPQFVQIALREHQERRAKERWLSGRPDTDEETICCAPDGQPPRYNVTTCFDTLLRRLGLPDITFHALRHSHSTLLLADGENPKVVSERLGHSDVRITLQVYGHVLPGMQERAAQRLDGMFGR